MSRSPGPHAVAGRYQHLGDAPREGRPHHGAVQVDAGLLGARTCPGETGFQLPAPTVVLRDRELAPVHRQRLAGLLLSCDVVAGQRADIRLGEVFGPLGGLAHEREKLELVTQCSSFALVALALVLELGFELLDFGAPLGENQARVPLVEGDQPLAGLRPLAFEHVDRDHVGGERGGQPGEARRIDPAEEREIGSEGGGTHLLHRHYPHLLLFRERRALRRALHEHDRAADSGEQDQERQCDAEELAHVPPAGKGGQRMVAVGTGGFADEAGRRGAGYVQALS